MQGFSKTITIFYVCFVIAGIFVVSAKHATASSIAQIGGLVAGNTCSPQQDLGVGLEAHAYDELTHNAISVDWGPGSEWTGVAATGPDPAHCQTVHSPSCVWDDGVCIYADSTHYNSAYRMCRWGYYGGGVTTATAPSVNICPGACTLPYHVTAGKNAYSQAGPQVFNNQAVLNDTWYPEGNGNRVKYKVRLTPTCTHECSTIGATRCLNSSTRQTCGNYDADSCREWGNNTSCGTDVCSGENWVDYKCASNACTSTTTADCGAWTNDVCGGGACTNGQMRQTRTCTHNCGVESRCVASSNCGGRFLGRIYLDANVNGARDAGEDTVYQSAKICNGWPILQATVNYSGPSSGLVINNQCNPSPHYATGILKEGDYTVSAKAPDGWAVTTPPQSANLSGGIDRHIWFGVNRLPIAEASIAKTLAGPWRQTVIITNAEPAIDKSKDSNFYLSALKDRTGDGLASRDPKGGQITCAWDYDVDNPDPSTEFTGCEIGDEEYTEAKRQEMIEYWKSKLEGTYTNVIELTVTDQYGLTDTDYVGILKEEMIPPKIKLLNIDTQCDAGTPLNLLKWEVQETTSYEIKYCEETLCTPDIPLVSKSFTNNPIELTHEVKDKTTYIYSFIAHGPGGDVEKTNAVLSKNCKGKIILATYLVNNDGKRLVLYPEVTVKLTDPSGTSVFATTISDQTGFARFEKLIPGTYGILAYKDKHEGYAKQAGDCLSNTYIITDATMGPNAITEGLIAAWDNNVPVEADKTTYCHDLGLFGRTFSVSCEASPNPARVKAPVTWTAQISGREPPYTYSWSGSESLSGVTKEVVKTYDNIGFKTAFVSVTAEGDTKTAYCEVKITGPPVCDKDEFKDNRFNRCLFDYNFNSSPDPNTVSNGTVLNVSDEPLLKEPTSDPSRQISAAVAFDYTWRGTIDFTEKSENVGGEWRGKINFKPDDYKFIVDSDDGVSVTIDLDGDGSLTDETPIINEWHKYDDSVKGHYESDYYSLNGPTKILLRWFEDTEKARIRFLWYNRTCHMTGLKNKIHVCFYKGIDPFTGGFIGERDEALFGVPANSFSHPINNSYGFAGEFGEIDNFSGIWRGIVNFEPGFYKFKVETDDGIRLDIGHDGIYEINEWRDHSGTYETEFIPLGGDVHMQLEWYEKEGPAKLNLFWSKKLSFFRPVLEKLFASLQSFFYGIIS